MLMQTHEARLDGLRKELARRGLDGVDEAVDVEARARDGGFGRRRRRRRRRCPPRDAAPEGELDAARRELERQAASLRAAEERVGFVEDELGNERREALAAARAADDELARERAVSARLRDETQQKAADLQRRNAFWIKRHVQH